MDIIFLGLIIFLFILAIFDLTVGVSNDAVNFLTSSIGSRAAGFKTIITVAAIGIFLGATMSNGMMDIARHGIFRPEYFSFFDLLCILMAVIVTDIIMLDIFNTIGLPTSTTVSMVFELLGASFAVALVKILGGGTSDLQVFDMLNTSKALEVILGIFTSVAIAFVFGTIVQFITRLIFSFEYRSRLRWKIGIFGGVACTAIVYFMLLKGIRDLTFMTPELKTWIDDHTWIILGCCLAGFTLLMQGLHFLKVNVLKVVVLTGTFALAMAFAGNDLVNFIGVPLAGLSAYQDYTAAAGATPDTHMMDALNGPANTPFYFLIGAGIVMVVSLATSKKARHVTKTEIGLGSQGLGDEMFGSSKIARRLVRLSRVIHEKVQHLTPLAVRRYIDSRFDTEKTQKEKGAAFDLIRAAVNLMLAGMLIALGTSLKLPLSTTFVTFMVAMGTSLADRAWSRESAVFRITGVISVIGGWFVTAIVAFLGAAIVVLLMHTGGWVVMGMGGVIAIILLIKSNRDFAKKRITKQPDTAFISIMTGNDPEQAWSLLQKYMADTTTRFLISAADTYRTIACGFATDNVKSLSRIGKSLEKEKDVLKNLRRKQTLCMQRVPRAVALEKNTWFHLSNNSSMAIYYNLRRINDVCLEHIDNNFLSLPEIFRPGYKHIHTGIYNILCRSEKAIAESDSQGTALLRHECDILKDEIGYKCHEVFSYLDQGHSDEMSVAYVYLNFLQESQEILSSLRKLLRASYKLLYGRLAALPSLTELDRKAENIQDTDTAPVHSTDIKTK